MAGKVVSVVLNAVVGPYQAAMARAAGTTSAFAANAKLAGGQVGGLAKSTGLVNSKLIGAAGLAFAIKSTADAAIEWESAFAGVRKTVDGTETEMAALEQGLRDMSTEIPVAATELASVAEAAGQLGVETQNIESFTETMAQLGVTTNLTATDAATQLARFANIMGTSQEEFDRLGSSVVELGNNFETTEAEILQLGLRMAAAGKIAGLSEGDLFGFATALTSVGVEAEAGGTAMSKVFTAINDAAIDGGDKLQTFAEVAGTSAAEFRAAVEEDAAGAVVSFINGLGRVSDAGESTTAIFEALELTDQRLMRALLSTASAGDKLNEAVATGNDAFEENNALQEEAAQRFGTTESQMQMAQNAIKDLQVEIGNNLLPVIGEAATALRDLLGLDVPGTSSTVSQLMGDFFQFGLDPQAVPGFIERKMAGQQAEQEQLAGLVQGINEVDNRVVDFVTGTGEGLIGWLQQGAEGFSDVAAEQGDMAMMVQNANGDLEHQLSLFREMTAGPVEKLIGALEDVEEAQAAYDEALQGTIGTADDDTFETQAEKTEAVEDATWQLYLANLSASEAADMAAGKYGAVEESIVGMFEANLISNEQMERLLALLGDTRREAALWERTYTMILDADLSPLQRKLASLRNEGFHVAVPGISGAGGITMHTGGVVSGNTGRMPGLAPDERVRVLQVGERVVSAQSAGAHGNDRGGGTTVKRQLQVAEGAVQIITRDAQSAAREAFDEIQLRYT